MGSIEAPNIALLTQTSFEPRLADIDGYRAVVGVEFAGSQLLLGTGYDGTPIDHERDVREEFDLGDAFAARIVDYFRDYYVNPIVTSDGEILRNCHIGAAVLTGIGNVDEVKALELAQSRMRNANPHSRRVPIGQRGIIGHPYVSGGFNALHSVVGLTRLSVLQTDFGRGNLSISTTRGILRNYQGRFSDQRVRLYA